MAAPHGVVTPELLARRSVEWPGPPKPELLARQLTERLGPPTWGSSSESFKEELPLRLYLNYQPDLSGTDGLAFFFGPSASTSFPFLFKEVGGGGTSSMTSVWVSSSSSGRGGSEAKALDTA